MFHFPAREICLMARSNRQYVAVAVVAVVTLATVSVVWYLRKPVTAAPPTGAAAFVECADAVGINFRMNFLPSEQGEKFKINLYDHGCGVAVGDYDGDGHEDIYFLNQLGRNALYRNRGDGTFEDVTEKAGVGLGDRICVGATFIDFDNDGHLDLFVTSTRGGNVLFRNMGDGTFKDVTAQAGLTKIAHSQTAVFFDYDNDGYLDLFLTNTAEWTTNNYDNASHSFVGGGSFAGGIIYSKKESNVLYHNNGDGTFTDVTEKAGLAGRGWAADAVAFDYDGDGRMDLFVTSMFGRCQLYRNNGDGTFTDETLKVLGRTPWGGIGANLIDFNNDGRLDLFVVDMHSDMWMGLDRHHAYREMATKNKSKKFPYVYGPLAVGDVLAIEREKQMGREVGFDHKELLFGNAFYRNEGGGRFTEISDAAGLETFWPWGVAVSDFDNDGNEDIYIPSGMGYPFYYWPNALMMNRGDGTFVDRAAEFGIEPPARGINQAEKIGGGDAVRSSRCAVTGDFRGNGRIDLVVNNFNDQPYFLRNEFRQKNYIELRLRGTVSNRDAIGAVARLYRGDKVLTRQVLGACGYLSQSSKVIHFGLGDSQTFDRIEITWPSGIRQDLGHIPANALHEIVEPGHSRH
jgi:hypothetical protein